MELEAGRADAKRGRLMAATTHVRAISHVAILLGEDPDLLEAIISNDDNLSYGSIVSVQIGREEPYRPHGWGHR